MTILFFSKIWRSYAVVIVLTVTLSACATNAGYQQQVKSFIGKNESDLIASWGAPDNTYTMKNGSKALIFTIGQGTVYCSTTFVLSPAGTVMGSTSKGNNCVASFGS